MDGCLDETGLLFEEAAHHLHTDHATGRLEWLVDDQSSSEQAEVAVGVTSWQLEQNLDDVVIDAADDLAMQRVTPAELEALHDVDLVGGERNEQRCFARVVLRVAVGVEDPLVSGRGEATDQCAAVAPVDLVVDDVQPWSRSHEPVEHGARVVGRAVVDDDHLDIVDQRNEGGVDVIDEAADGLGVVVAREHRRDA